MTQEQEKQLEILVAKHSINDGGKMAERTKFNI